MNFFPLFVQLQNAPCLVVGGGEIAERKIRLLTKGGARIHVMAPETSEAIAAWADAGTVVLTRRPFDDGAVEGMKLVIAATSDREVNAAVSRAAEAHNVLCNVVDDRELSTAIMPAMVDRSPLVIAVSSGGAAPVLATRIRQQLEQQFPPAYENLVRFAEQWRGRVKEALGSVRERRYFWQAFFDGPAARELLDGNTAAAADIVQSQLDSARDDATGDTNGFAWIVGAGPGDPELLTLKAARVLGSADVVLHDRLVSPRIIEMARRDAEFISVGKQAGKPSIKQEDINALLVAKVQAGLNVCRLKGGDPFVFGRGGEEIEALQTAGLPWQVVPGITAASGCAAATGIPLTHREVARSVTLLTAHTKSGPDKAVDEIDWQRFTAPDQTLVIYMGVGTLKRSSAALIKAGRSSECPVVVIENGTTPRQRMVKGTLADIAERVEDAGLGSPAVVMVGEVTALGELLAAGVDNPEHATWAQAAEA